MNEGTLAILFQAEAILIGSSRFPRDPTGLDDLPGVVANVIDFERLLLDDRFVGLQPTQVNRIIDEDFPHIVAERVADLSAQAASALVIYYAGHGIVGPNGELLLAVSQSTYQHAESNAVRWEQIKASVIRSPAKYKIVILDCCFSGRASSLGDNEDVITGSLEAHGTVVICSSPKNSISVAPKNLRRTLFTDAFLSAIESGIPNAGPTLTLAELFTETRRRLRSLSAPEPQMIATGMATDIPICINASASVPAARVVEPAEGVIAQQRGLGLEAMHKLYRTATSNLEIVSPISWSRILEPDVFAENLATVLAATQGDISISQGEARYLYAVLLLIGLRNEITLQQFPDLSAIADDSKWSRDLVAVSATTDRLLERSLDPDSSDAIRKGIDDWIVRHIIAKSGQGWQAQELEERRDALASALSADDIADLSRRLLIDAQRIQTRTFPGSALNESWAYSSSSSGKREYIRSHIVFALAVVLSALHYDVALDGRELIEQLGIVESFTLEHLDQDLRELRWVLSEAGDLVLIAQCFDPAVEASLRAYVHRLKGLSDFMPDTPEAMALRRFVLGRATADGVGPRAEDSGLAYERPISRLTMNSEKIRSLLMGEQLYGEPRLAMRELYQNSLDACRFRMLRHEYLSRESNIAMGWEPRIKFESVYSDSGALLRLDCWDNGTGMRRGILESCFLDAGSRFVETSSYAEEQAEWLRLDPRLRLTPNSTFGIGVFSYFMLADAVEVFTRGQNPDGSLDAGLRLLINAGSTVARILGDPRVSSMLPEGGTLVRLHLRPEYRSVSRLQLRNFLDEVVLFSPIALEISEGIEEADRAPGELSPESPSSDSLAWHEGESAAWWASRSAPVLADGIRTPAELFGIMVTLHGEHKPTLRVDRNDLISWDSDWVLQKTADAAASLAAWPGLTLRWLWSFAEAYPYYGRTLFEEVISLRNIVPLGQSKYWGREVDLTKVGCFPGDRYLVRTLHDRFETQYPDFLVPEVRKPTHRFGGPNIRFPSCLRPWRRRVWLECLPELFEGWDEDTYDVSTNFTETIATPADVAFSVWEPETLPGVKNPDPIDAALLASQPSILSSHLPWGAGAGHSAVVDIVALIHGAARSRISLGESIKRLAEFARFGLRCIPSIDSESMNYVPTAADCQLVTSLGEAWAADRVITNRDFLGLLPVCQELSVSVGEASSALEQLLARLGVRTEIVSKKLKSKASHVPSAREVRFFGFDEYDRGHELRYGRGTRAALIRGAWRADMAAADVARMVDRYSAFGMSRYRPLLKSIELGTTDERLLTAWSSSFDRRAPWVDEEVFRRGYISDRPSSVDELLGHSLFFAILNSLSFRQSAEIVFGFPGLSADQRRIDFESIDPFVPTELDLKLIRDRVGERISYQDKILDGIGQTGLLRRRISPLEIKLAAREENVSIEFVFDRLKHFQSIGVTLPECTPEVLDAYEFSDLAMELVTTEDPSLGAFEHHVGPDRGKKPIVKPIPALHVFAVACEQRKPLGEVADVLFELSSVGIEVGCRRVPVRASDYVPSRADLGMAVEFSRASLGMAICGIAQRRGHSIGFVCDSIQRWLDWLLDLPESSLDSYLETIRDDAGMIEPTYSDVSFYSAASGQASGAGSLSRVSALVLAAQGNVSIDAAIRNCLRFGALFAADNIDLSDLRLCPPDLGYVVPDSKWVIAATRNAIAGRRRLQIQRLLGVTSKVRAAVARLSSAADVRA